MSVRTCQIILTTQNNSQVPLLSQEKEKQAEEVRQKPKKSGNDDYDDEVKQQQQQKQKQNRKLMIDLVLATDIARHFTLLASFNAKTAVDNLNLNKVEDLGLLLQMLMKLRMFPIQENRETTFWDSFFSFLSSSLIRPAQDSIPFMLSLSLYLQWVDRIAEEFFVQGDRERALALPSLPSWTEAPPRSPSPKSTLLNSSVHQCTALSGASLVVLTFSRQAKTTCNIGKANSEDALFSFSLRI